MAFSKVPTWNPLELNFFKQPQVSQKIVVNPRKSTTRSYVNVRSEDEIAHDQLHVSDRNHKHFINSEKKQLLSAQVMLHEIDEGLRQLIQNEKLEAVHQIGALGFETPLQEKLKILRHHLEQAAVYKKIPQQISQCHKVRNNQWGGLTTDLGPHPTLAFTAIGVGKKICNEDAYVIVPHLKALAIADGMGGHVGGSVASCIAVDFFEYALRHGMGLADSVAYANDAIFFRSLLDPKLRGQRPMGCTFAATQLKGQTLSVAHVGDSKILVVRRGQIVFQTTDHTKGQQLLRESLVDTGTAFELNHILTRSLGYDAMRAARDVEFQQFSLELGDRVVLVSDGFTDNFFDADFGLDEMSDLAAAGTLHEAADRLVETCYRRMLSVNLPSGRLPKQDNLSLMMLEFRSTRSHA